MLLGYITVNLHISHTKVKRWKNCFDVVMSLRCHDAITIFANFTVDVIILCTDSTFKKQKYIEYAACSDPVMIRQISNESNETVAKCLNWNSDCLIHTLLESSPVLILPTSALNMLNCFKDNKRCIHILHHTLEDWINNGATLHVSSPILAIPCLLMLWWL